METFFLLGMSQTGVYQMIFWLINVGEVGLFLLGVCFGFVLRAVFDSRKGLFPILVLVANSKSSLKPWHENSKSRSVLQFATAIKFDDGRLI